MVITTHSFESQEFRQLSDYAPCGIYWGPSVVFSWLLGCLEGSKQLQWHARVPWWGQLEAGHNRTLPPLSISAQSLPTCLSSWRVIRLLTPWLRVLRPKSSKMMEISTQPLKGGPEPTWQHFQGILLVKAVTGHPRFTSKKKSPLFSGGMSESLPSSYIISRCGHTRNWEAGQVKTTALGVRGFLSPCWHDFPCVLYYFFM